MKTAPGLAVAALGAILRYAVDASSDTFDLKMIGLILMIVGAVAFIVGVVKDFTHRPASDRQPHPSYSPPPPASATAQPAPPLAQQPPAKQA